MANANRKIIIAIEVQPDGSKEIIDCLGNKRIAFSDRELGHHINGILNDKRIPNITEESINPVVEMMAQVTSKLNPNLAGIAESGKPFISQAVGLVKGMMEERDQD